MAETYDVIIIGSGPGGYVTAIALAMRLWNILGEVLMALLTVAAERLWPIAPTRLHPPRHTITTPVDVVSADTVS